MNQSQQTKIQKGVTQQSRKKKKLNACVLLHPSESSVFARNASQLESEAYKYNLDAEQVLKRLNFNVQVQYLSSERTKALHQIKKREKTTDVFVNMSEPTISGLDQSLIDYMIGKGIPFTGSSICDTLDREKMKKICYFQGVPTTSYIFVNDYEDLKRYPEVGDFPLFVKPEAGYDSVCVSEKSIVRNEQQLTERVEYVWKNYGSVLLQKFIDGREFTVLIAGNRENCVTFPALERVFKQGRNILSFDDKYGTSYEASWKNVQDKELDTELQKLTKKFYQAAYLDGYARMDFRQDKEIKQLYLIDPNPYCTLFISSDCCSTDTILRNSGWSKEKFMTFLIDEAFKRSQKFHKNRKWELKHSKERGMHVVANQDVKKDDLVFTDQMRYIRIVTEEYVMQNWNAEDIGHFKIYSWKLGDKVFAIWDQDPNVWRPINHSCDPSIYCKGMGYYARRDLKKGDDLTMHYSTFLQNHPEFACWCKAKECKGKVLPEGYKDPEFQKKYKGQLSAHIQTLVDRMEKQK